MLHQSFDIDLVVAIVLGIAIAAIVLIGVLHRRATRAARDLISAGERYRQIAEALREIVWTATPDGQIEYGNRALVEYTGLSVDKLVSAGWNSTLHPDDFER